MGRSHCWCGGSQISVTTPHTQLGTWKTSDCLYYVTSFSIFKYAGSQISAAAWQPPTPNRKPGKMWCLYQHHDIIVYIQIKMFFFFNRKFEFQVVLKALCKIEICSQGAKVTDIDVQLIILLRYGKIHLCLFLPLKKSLFLNHCDKYLSQSSR